MKSQSSKSRSKFVFHLQDASKRSRSPSSKLENKLFVKTQQKLSKLIEACWKLSTKITRSSLQASSRSSSLKSRLQDIVTKNYSKVCQNASRQNSSIVAKSRRLPKRPVLRLFQNSTKTRRKPSELVESTFFKAPSFKRSRSPSMTSIFVAVFSKPSITIQTHWSSLQNLSRASSLK